MPYLTKGYFGLIEFLQAVSRIRKSGKRVAIILSPSEAQVTPDKQQELVERFNIELSDYDEELPIFLIQQAVNAVDSQIPVLSLFDAFVCATRENQDLYYGTDTHWSVEGNKLAGDSLARFIALDWFQKKTDIQACSDNSNHNRTVVSTDLRATAFKNYLFPMLDSSNIGLTNVQKGILETYPPVANLYEVQGTASFAIGTINGLNWDKLNLSEPISMPEHSEFVTLTGWAVDLPAKKSYRRNIYRN